MTSNFPEGMTSSDWAHVYGEQYAPDAPRPELLAFGANVIYFDYTVLPDGPYGDFEVRVEACGMTGAYDNGWSVIDFEHVRTFKDAESAQDWVYSFLEASDEGATYEQVKGAIKNGD